MLGIGIEVCWGQMTETKNVNAFSSQGQFQLEDGLFFLT